MLTCIAVNNSPSSCAPMTRHCQVCWMHHPHAPQRIISSRKPSCKHQAARLLGVRVVSQSLSLSLSFSLSLSLSLSCVHATVYFCKPCPPRKHLRSSLFTIPWTSRSMNAIYTVRYGIRNPYKTFWDVPTNRYYAASVGGNLPNSWEGLCVASLLIIPVVVPVNLNLPSVVVLYARVMFDCNIFVQRKSYFDAYQFFACDDHDTNTRLVGSSLSSCIADGLNLLRSGNIDRNHKRKLRFTMIMSVGTWGLLVPTTGGHSARARVATRAFPRATAGLSPIQCTLC